MSLLDGTKASMKSLAERTSLKDVWVYSLDSNQNVVPGKVTRAWKTGTRDTLIVTLDNGGTFRCTADHPVMLRDGSFCKAGELSPGTSVMPLYTRLERINKSTSEYEQVYNPATGDYQFTHRRVAGTRKGQVIHHVNFNRFDNRPTNLKHLGVTAHIRLHGDNATEINERMWAALSPEQRSIRARKAWTGTTREDRQRILAPAIAAVRARMVDPVTRKAAIDNARLQLSLVNVAPGRPAQRIAELRRRWAAIPKEARATYMAPAIEAAATWHHIHPSHKKGMRTHWVTKGCELSGCSATFECRVSRTRRFCCKAHSALWRENSGNGQKGKPAWNLGLKNHKVVSVAPGGVEDVYDLTVEGHHNFALTCGVFVHNCTADIMAVWALDHLNDLEQELAHGGDLSTYEIPMGVFGPTSLSSMVPTNGNTAHAGGAGQNPLAMAARTPQVVTGVPIATPTTREGELKQWLSNTLVTQVARKK